MKCAPSNTTKGKCYLCLNEKLEITSYKRDSLLNKRSELNSKCRHQNKFTPLLNDSKDWKLRFHWNISRSISVLEIPFWPARLMFRRKWFSRLKSRSSKEWIHWITFWVIFPVNTARKGRHSFVWRVLHCNFFITR